MLYAQILFPTPVFNISNFNLIFGDNPSLKLLTDEKGHVRELEFIALKDMIFQIIEKIKTRPFIYKVKCDFYKSNNLYIDSRFFKIFHFLPKQKISYQLNKTKIIDHIVSLQNTSYVWGGNCHKGINKILDLYPPQKKQSKIEKNNWVFKGVDCSGLLFEATNGYTPRNTSELLTFKKGLEIENKTIHEIISSVKPLDIIVYKGHVIIVLNQNFSIESKEIDGVIKKPLYERLEELSKEKNFVNIYQNSNDLVIRRIF